MRLWQYLLMRLAYAVPVVLGVLSVVFLVLRLSGDPVALFLSPSDVTPAEVERVRRALGFDRPLYVQYLTFLRSAASGDFGTSLMFQQPALPLVLERLPLSLMLTGASLVVSMVIAIPIGILGAVTRGGHSDRLSSMCTGVAQGMPPFWLGLLLINLFAVQLRWLPTSGTGTPLHLVLPALTLGLYMTARTSRLTRSAMLGVLGQEYIRTARAKGLHEASIVARHGLRNALIPVLTISAVTFASLLSNAIVIEAVFAWPGVGRLLIDSVFSRDYPLVQAAVFVIALLVILTNILNDVLCVAIDPRIQLR